MLESKKMRPIGRHANWCDNEAHCHCALPSKKVVGVGGVSAPPPPGGHLQDGRHERGEVLGYL